MADFARLQEAQQLLSGDPIRRRVLELLRNQTAANGWSIAKTLDQNPDVVKKALTDLRSGGLIDSENGSGIDGFYFLTGMAFQLFSSMAS